MHTELHWLDGRLPGKLAISARPRGGDWLEDELRGWRHAGVTEVVSLLTPGEEASLDLEAEARLCDEQSLFYRKLSIEDRDIPRVEAEAMNLVDTISRELARGQNVVVHCRQGIGRAGMITAAILIHNGLAADDAIEQVSHARGISIPETTDQFDWIRRFARSFHEVPAGKH